MTTNSAGILIGKLRKFQYAFFIILLGAGFIGNGFWQTFPARASTQIPLNPSSFLAITSLSKDNSSTNLPTNDPHLAASTGQGVTLELEAPEPSINTRAVDGKTCQSLSVPGWVELDKAGYPALPVRGAMLGIPGAAYPVIKVLDYKLASLPGHYNLCPVSQPVLESNMNGVILGTRDQMASDPLAYAVNSYYPAKSVELVSTGYIRSQRIAELRFQPFQYNPVSGELRVYQWLKVKVEWGPAAGNAPQQSARDENLFEPILKNILLNYNEARAWRNSYPTPSLPSHVSGLNTNSPAYKISVDQDGIYQLTYAQLQSAGAPVSAIDPKTFKLANQGVEVAISVAGEGDHVFGPGDYILFYGQKTQTKYTNTNVYWLTWGGSNGARIVSVEGAPGLASIAGDFVSTLHLEEDHIYQPGLSSGTQNDHWYWSNIYATGPSQTITFTFDLQNLATVPMTATVSGLFKGYAATPQHHTQVFLNHHQIVNATWAPQAEFPFSANIPQSYLVEGANTINVVAPMDNGITLDVPLINWFEIAYQHTYVSENDRLFFSGDSAGVWKYQVSGFTHPDLDVFDITAPASPTYISNPAIQAGNTYTLTFQQSITQTHQYLALSTASQLSPINIVEDKPSDLHNPSNRVDYLIITHSNFYTDVLPLSAYRSSQGLHTMVVDVEDVYDEFSGGVFDPQAIHDFLAYVYASWSPPAPLYVLLVGDGNYDFKNNLGTNEPNYIPPYLANVDPWLGETATDNYYVSVSGLDNLPDMNIGRLPVKTRAEAAGVVSKIIGYEQNAPVGNWNEQALFVTDKADAEGNFPALSDATAALLPAPYTAQKVYYGVNYNTVASAHTAIVDAVNQGKLVVNYVGHGATDRWNAYGLFGVSDLPSLTNASSLPLMLPMTCMDGYFIMPPILNVDRSSLGESIVTAANKGAIASWSPTGLGISAGHDYLDRGLFQALFNDDLTQIGPATTQAKFYLYSTTGSYTDLIDTYVLFGDPATRLKTLPADAGISLTSNPSDLIKPNQLVTYVLHYTNAGPATAHHVVINDLVSSELISPTFVSSGAAITLTVGSNLTWQVADLAVGQGGVITITAVTAPVLTQPISNTASITTSAYEVNTANNTFGPIFVDVNLYKILLPIVVR